ncbi:hypothetical protein BH23GEM9_BH23GEM9_09640 [soil metagenome]
MTVDRQLLASYFRQLAELGVTEIAFDGLTAEQALALLSGTAPAAGGGAAESTNGSGLAAARSVAAIKAALAETTPEAPQLRSASHRGAGDIAAAADSAAAERLQALAVTAAACALCRLHEGRSSVVFGEGNPAADVVVVGEAPGQEEDRTGRPFVGRAGRLLDLLLLTAGFPREEVYICNVLKCRPPNNRNPLPDEVAACTTSFLNPQLEAIAPRVLLAAGKFAAQALLETDESIGRLRGSVHSWHGIPLVATYHPAYLLRSPQMTRVAWHDFQLVRKVLHEQA